MSYANFVETQLDGPLTAEGLSLLLQPAQAPYQLPPADGGVLVLADSMGKPAAVEIIRYAARDGLTLTGLERGLEGTVALNWPGNSYCYQSLTAGGFEAVKEIIDVHVADQNPHPQYLVAESAVSLEGPTGIYIAQSVQFQITDYDVFSGYLVQVSAGTASIAGSTISFTAPMEAGSVTLTVFAGDYRRDITLEILPERPAAPVITSPEAAGVMGNPTLSTGPFALIGPNTDTHAATDWEIWTGAGRTGTLVWSSLNNSTSKLSITLPENTLTVSTDYHMAVRHIGTTFGAGEWAELAFRTADQFLPTVIGQAFGGGFYAGKIRYADGDYIIIVAPKAAETSLSHKTANSATAGTSSYHDGLANSNNMNNATHPAAQYCRAYNGGGFTDWHLPARDQLELLYRNLKPDTTANYTGTRAEAGNHGDNANSVPVGASYTTGSPAQTSAAAFKAGGAEAFAVPTWYWTSTEYAPNTANAWIQRFSDGAQGNNNKTNACLVRPVRRLKI
ncbi:DUF1566 domain-containing protein [Stutzerimonas stutzeri]|uniref:Lcl C-terminal domain-containing protein n=1 Tax=Stutzerimonas stutzeri TaxID=316 RepID=UPI002447B60A|nr:DUF1566 domain-containing protein [Stutzerimonas stutzeri]MDH0156486.1 DUF1566 domain-containing protein [Stutzerimonas stutzeri]